MFRMEQTSILNFWLKVGRFIGSQDRMRESVDGRPRWALSAWASQVGRRVTDLPQASSGASPPTRQTCAVLWAKYVGFIGPSRWASGWVSKVVAARRVNGVTE
jgi:hypothetical protein